MVDICFDIILSDMIAFWGGDFGFARPKVEVLGGVKLASVDFRSGFSVRIFGEDFCDMIFTPMSESRSPSYKSSQWSKKKICVFWLRHICKKVLLCPYHPCMCPIMAHLKSSQNPENT
jgi:hypothetical protein